MNTDPQRFPNETSYKESTIPTDGNAVPNYDAAPPRSEGCKWFAIGCGTVALMLIMMLMIGGFWIYRNFKRVAASGVVTMASEVIKETDLPPEQQRQLTRRIEDLGEQYAEGEVTLEELTEVGERLAQDEAIITAGVVYFVESQLVEQASIDDEMRSALTLTMQRLARGVIEDKLELEDLRPLSEEVIEETPDGWQLKSGLTPQDFAKVLESARQIADDAEIPDEPYEVDFVKEVDAVIDEVLIEADNE